MSYFFLIPVSVVLGLCGLGAFFWSLRHDQYDDLEGAAVRILITPDTPAQPPTFKEAPRGPADGAS